MNRIIVLDTETTGFSHAEGHRIVEIGCVELVDMRKGEARQWYINPQRDIPAEATEVHGITNERVANEPPFEKIAQEFLRFIGDAPLAIHNAQFDMGFLNMELKACGYGALESGRAIDTLALSRRRFPGAPASLDALCKRLGVDNSRRTFHGALLDAHLLAEVYIELLGGNQFRLDLSAGDDSSGPIRSAPGETPPLAELVIPARSWPIAPTEAASHAQFLELLQKESKGQCVWLRGDA